MDWKKNRLIIGTVVLVVLGGLTVWAFSKPKDTPVEQDEEIASLPEIDKAAVTSLEIHRPASGDLAAETVRLEKRDDGWWMVEPVEAQADQGVVDTALDKLAELEVERVAATNEENHARLEVDPEHAVRVVAGGAEGNLVDLWLGSFGGGSTMVRPEGQDAVLAVPGSIKFAFNKQAKDWRNRSVTDVRPTDVVAVSFQNENGTWRFERNAEDEWTQPEGQPEIERFGSAKVQSVVASLARMRAVDFAASDVTAEQAGLGEGAAVARLTVRQGGAAEEPAEGEAAEGEAAEGEAAQPEGESPTPASTEEIVLRLGGESGDGQFYLQREGNDVIYVVSQFLADKVRVNAESFQTPEGGEQAAAPGDAPGGMPGMPGGGMPGMPGGGMPPGMGHGGPGGGGQIPPEVMQQIQQQLQKQQAAGGGGSPH